MESKEKLKEKKFTALTVLKETAARLREVGKMSETYDTLINRLIDEHLESQKLK